MDMLALKNEIGSEGLDQLAEKVESSPAYLSQIAHGHRKPSPALCRRLVAAEPRLTLSALRPDVYETAPADQAA